MSPKPKNAAGVVGLGSMGFAIASNLVRAGFAVSGFDPSAAARDRAAASGITISPTAADVFAAADVIVLSLPTAGHVETVIAEARASGALGPEAPAKVVVDSSTSEASVSRRLSAELAGDGHGFLDAPVSGGPAGAAAGQLSVMLGGDEAAVARATGVLETMAAKVVHVGPSGTGNVAKLVNNMLVASHMITTLEALRLAQSAGVSAESALRVINSATGRSALSEVHYPNWVLTRTFDSGFSTGLMRKDVRLARALAAETHVATPLADLVAALWDEANSGLADTDDFMLMGDPEVDRLTGKETV